MQSKYFGEILNRKKCQTHLSRTPKNQRNFLNAISSGSKVICDIKETHWNASGGNITFQSLDSCALLWQNNLVVGGQKARNALGTKGPSMPIYSMQWHKKWRVVGPVTKLILGLWLECALRDQLTLCTIFESLSLETMDVNYHNKF